MSDQYFFIFLSHLSWKIQIIFHIPAKTFFLLKSEESFFLFKSLFANCEQLQDEDNKVD